MTSSARRLLFIGDSITDAGRRDDAEGLGDGYVRLIAGSLRSDPVTVINRGVGGDRTVDLLTRWQNDCVDVEPDVVTIFVGINDVWRAFSSGEPTPVERFEATYRELLVRARAGTSAELVLMPPFVLPVDPGQGEWLVDLEPKQQVVRQLAAEFEAVLVPLDRVMGEAGSSMPPRALADDGVHPTAHGHQLIADAWTDAGVTGG